MLDKEFVSGIEVQVLCNVLYILLETNFKITIPLKKGLCRELKFRMKCKKCKPTNQGTNEKK